MSTPSDAWRTRNGARILHDPFAEVADQSVPALGHMDRKCAAAIGAVVLAGPSPDSFYPTWEARRTGRERLKRW